MSVYIEGIDLEHFSASHHPSPFLVSDNGYCWALFHSLLYDDNKQDAETTAEHSKIIIELLQNRTVFFSEMNTIWETVDGCAEQYRCAPALYLISMLVQAYNIIIDRDDGETVNGIEIVYGLNDNDNIFIWVLMTTVHLPDVVS